MSSYEELLEKGILISPELSEEDLDKVSEMDLGTDQLIMLGIGGVVGVIIGAIIGAAASKKR